jgi:predicted N-acetyltransferase YhbS
LPNTRQGLSRHFPIPIAILARLAINSSHQSRGLGPALLDDALARVSRASELVAVRAVVARAVDENAATFYERFGFQTFSASHRTVMVTLSALRAAG